MPIKGTGSAQKYGTLKPIEEEKPSMMLALPAPESNKSPNRGSTRAVVALPHTQKYQH